MIDFATPPSNWEHDNMINNLRRAYEHVGELLAELPASETCELYQARVHLHESFMWAEAAVRNQPRGER